jgi:hypothetical protein
MRKLYHHPCCRWLDSVAQRGNTSSVNVELIRARLKNGFRPFAIVTSSGNRYPVPRPEFLMVTPRTVAVADRRGYAAVLDPLHVVSLEDLPARPSGRGRRKAKA